MKVSRKQIALVIDDLLQAGVSPTRISKEVAAYLLREGRASEVAPISRDIIEQRASRGILEANVTSAHKLEDQNLSEIKRAVRKIHPGSHQLIINKMINPHLLGGLKLNVINDQLDLTIRAKINRFKELTNLRGV